MYVRIPDVRQLSVAACSGVVSVLDGVTSMSMTIMIPFHSSHSLTCLSISLYHSLSWRRPI